MALIDKIKNLFRTGPPNFIQINSCKSCGRQASKIEITPNLFLKYSGPGGWNGLKGDKISEQDALNIKLIFTTLIEPKPLKARFYDQGGYCDECQCFYCEKCWKASNGFGECPVGHGKGLDSHWSPETD